MGPKILVLSGMEAVERAHNLINAMVHRPDNLDAFGRTVVDLMAHPHADINQLADIIQPLMKNHILDDKDDPGFDQRVMYEAVTFAAKMFTQAFNHQAPGLEIRDYRFNRWLNKDLVLERHGSL